MRKFFWGTTYVWNEHINALIIGHVWKITMNKHKEDT